MRRVLFLNSRSELGGSDICLLEIVLNLDPDQFSSIVVLPHDGPLVKELTQAGASIVYTDLNPLERPNGIADIVRYLLGAIPATLRLYREIQKRSIDIVYTNSSAIQVGAVAAFLARKPHIWHVREIWSTPYWLKRGLYGFAYRFSHRVITVSHCVKQSAFPNDHKSKVVVIYDGVNLAKYASNIETTVVQEEPTIPSTDHLFVIGIVGRMVPGKGHLVLLRAIHKLVTDGEKVKLLVIGDIPKLNYQDYKNELYEYVRQAGLTNHVEFLGWQQDVPSLLRRLQVLVLPSTKPEGLGVVIPEAWATGVPVIASDAGGPGEIIISGTNGLVFPSGNVDELCHSIKQLIHDPCLRKKLVENGYHDVKAKFDSFQNTLEIEVVLNSVTMRANC